jgi:altronate hydrolase
VATLLADAATGEAVVADGVQLTAAMAIPRGHKIALAAIAPGEAVIKYGFPIGRATAAIAVGGHVHSDNVATALAGQQAYAYAPTPRANLAPGDAIFQGYRRGDGRVGTRNEIWILPTVGCVARTAERIVRQHGDDNADIFTAGTADGDLWDDRHDDFRE